MDARAAELPVGNLSGLRPLDIATHAMLGSDPREPLPPAAPGADGVEVLRDGLARALEGGRCFVSFSGGGDSTAMLALTADVARERGLPQPIPLTMRFPEASTEKEDPFQEEVVRHLGLDEWVRLDFRDELELLGPVARSTMLRFGIMFPSPAFTMVPMLQAASGGRLMIGMGQSDFYGYWRWSQIADVLLGNRRPRKSDLKLLAFSLLHRRIRAALILKDPRLQIPWLRPEPRRAAAHELATRLAEAPMRFTKAVTIERLHRCHRGSVQGLEALSFAAGTELVLPLYEASYHSALLQSIGWRGWGSRSSALKRLAGHLLPADATGRRDTTNFQTVLWGPQTRAFARDWSGRGLDDELVDAEALQREWLKDCPDFRSSLLIHLAWLIEATREAGGAHEPALAAAEA